MNRFSVAWYTSLMAIVFLVGACGSAPADNMVEPPGADASDNASNNSRSATATWRRDGGPNPSR